jgi:hypothetical protein
MSAYSNSFYDFCQKYGKMIAPSYEKSNCVQFMDQALKKFLGISDPILTKHIYINHPLEKIQAALKNNDVSVLGGVCYGLTCKKLASWVELNTVQKGDIVQYWSTDGFINGHCGIFHEFDSNGNMILIGSHGDSHGYGYMNVYNTTMKCQFYICRLN